VKVKICGITNVADAREAVAAGADFLGLVFAPSRRRVTCEKARRIIQSFPRFKNWVGVFVDEDPAVVSSVVCELGILIVQLHGNETSANCAKIVQITKHWKTNRSCGGKVKIIKALRIRSARDILKVKRYKGVCGILLDTYVKGKPGGTGQTFNWQWARQARKFRKKIFLSGGLNPSNVTSAVKTVRPYAVDVSSGVELRPGKKSRAKLYAFIRFAKKTKQC
jgi:phosphoribosylanthranilate isomerase